MNAKPQCAVYASWTRKEKFSGRDKNCQKNVLDLEDSLVTSSRSSGQPQKRPNDRTSNAGVKARAADGSRPSAGAADKQCPMCWCSSPSCTVVPCAADIGEQLHKACASCVVPNIRSEPKVRYVRMTVFVGNRGPAASSTSVLLLSNLFALYTVFQKNRTPETFYYNFATIALIWIKKLVHTTQPAYGVIKLQYYKTYITLSQQHWNWNAPCSHYNLHDYILISLLSNISSSANNKR